MISKGAIISHVEPGSIAAELELQPGDKLLKINGSKLVDLIDYLFLSGDEDCLTLEVAKESGEIWEIDLDKDPGEPLGLSFTELVFDRVRSCGNHCLFCFVHQLPAGQRASLYVKDDDYRLSFLQGSYITLTNLNQKDWQRILALRLSPLYISVHATEPMIRQRLLGCKKATPILEQMQRLTEAGITLHTQAVLCPGVNDGSVLENTIRDLIRLWPKVASLAIVPVGLTGYRANLFPLRPFTKDEASRVLEIIHRYQVQNLSILGSRFVFAADEWYIIADEAFPDNGEYEDYLQLDNGIGLIRHFLTDLEQSLDISQAQLGTINARLVLVTGIATGRMWKQALPFLIRHFPDLNIEILPVTNRFFGPTVTVTGLLVGRDIQSAILEHAALAESPTLADSITVKGETVYLIPRITMKADQELFLDGIAWEELRESCVPNKIIMVPSAAASWLEWLAEFLEN